jgi:signal transduction histidine kinase
MRQDLEKKVAERTQELQASNELKDKLFAVIAHDLRGPVGNLKSFLDILVSVDQVEYQAVQAEFLEIMRDNASAILTLLDNLLSWARFQQHSLVPDPSVQDLIPIIKEVLSVWSGTAHKKSIDLQYAGPELVRCRYDRTMISLVIRNLVGNALKFTPASGTIRIRLEEKSQTWTVSVSDTGVGMKPEHLERLKQGLFDRSTQGTEHEKGSGLGLMLCHDFLQQNGSRLLVDSLSGQGSTFSFDLSKT